MTLVLYDVGEKRRHRHPMIETRAARVLHTTVDLRPVEVVAGNLNARAEAARALVSEALELYGSAFDRLSDE